ncbi:hypothetical protein BJ166DRAFT_500055 [Pestalotiopsis sp. NC0098]|nr:hypothetical protein BJ166DRAFT_500055 [Pestalotiopsis sp. NC0098]
MRLRVCQALLLNCDTRTATLANEYESRRGGQRISFVDDDDVMQCDTAPSTWPFLFDVYHIRQLNLLSTPRRYFVHDWTFTVTVAALTKTPVLVYHALGPQHHWHVHLIDLVPNGKFHAQQEPRRSPACFGYTSARVKYASLRVLGSTPMTKGRQSWHVLV